MEPTQTRGLISRLTDFLSRPFQEEMDAGQWFLFTIFIVSIAVLWCRVLAHVEPVEL